MIPVCCSVLCAREFPHKVGDILPTVPTTNAFSLLMSPAILPPPLGKDANAVDLFQDILKYGVDHHDGTRLMSSTWGQGLSKEQKKHLAENGRHIYNFMNAVLSPHERDVLAYRGDLNSTRRTITEQLKNKTQRLVVGCLFAFTEMNGIKSKKYDYTRDGFTWRTCLGEKGLARTSISNCLMECGKQGSAIKLLVPDPTMVDLVKVNMEVHLVYTLCSANAIYTYFGIGGDGMLDAGSTTPTMMGAGGNEDHPPNKRRRSDD